MMSLLSILFLAFAANAAVIRVAKDGLAPFIEVQPAIDAASPSDTIFVYPGSYQGFSVNKSLTIIGSGNGTAVNRHTKITSALEIFGVADNSSIQGLWLSCPAGNNLLDYYSCALRVHAGASNVFLKSCYVENTNGGNSSFQGSVYFGDLSSGIIEGCVLDCRPESQPGNTDAGIILDGAANINVSNSVFVGIDYGFYGGSAATTIYAQHCIFALLTVVAVSGAGYVENSFCRVLGSSYPNIPIRYSAFMSGASGEGNINAPLNSFVNYVENDARQSDYHLVAGSIMIDAGKPTSPPDQDGSRTDIGIYGGQTPFLDNGYPPFPIVTDLDVPSSVPQNGVLRFGARGRIGQGN